MSKIEIRPFERQHAIEIAESGARMPDLKIDEDFMLWLDQAEQFNKLSFSGFLEGRLVGCGGLVIPWPGMAEAWILLVKDIQKLCVNPAVVRRKLKGLIRKYGLRRVQAPLRADFDAGIKYAKYLGFEYEGCHRKYHRDGTDAYMYAIIKGDK